MPEQARIYNFDPKTDGWKQLPGAEVKTIKIDQKMRGIREYDIPLTHYFKSGTAFCGATEVEGTTFYNDVRNQCDACRQGVREQTKEAKAALEAVKTGDRTITEAESINVIDYKANAVKDKPESSKVSH